MFGTLTFARLAIDDMICGSYNSGLLREKETIHEVSCFAVDKPRFSVTPVYSISCTIYIILNVVCSFFTYERLLERYSFGDYTIPRHAVPKESNSDSLFIILVQNYAHNYCSNNIMNIF